MGKKVLLLFAGILALIPFAAGTAFGQPRQGVKIIGEGEAGQLGKNFEVNLVVEPSEAERGFTVLTATEHFLVETAFEKASQRIDLRFEGKIKLRASQVLIGERRLGRGQPLLVSYRIKITGNEKEKEGGFSFSLEGSALLEENQQVDIARSRDMIVKLKVSSLQEQ